MRGRSGIVPWFEPLVTLPTPITAPVIDLPIHKPGQVWPRAEKPEPFQVEQNGKLLLIGVDTLFIGKQDIQTVTRRAVLDPVHGLQVFGFPDKVAIADVSGKHP